MYSDEEDGYLILLCMRVVWEFFGIADLYTYINSYYSEAHNYVLQQQY